MACTVTQVAKLSGVTVRTLRFYDQIGLLKPARVGANGYRYYEAPELLRLQQIHFHRELGFDLERIRSILGQDDFDRLAPLKSHRQVLVREQRRLGHLVRTIDCTLRHLKGTLRMNQKEFCQGFDPEKQAGHERYLIDRYGAIMKEAIAASRRRVRNWTRDDWERSGAGFAALCRALAGLRQSGHAAGSAEVQDVIRRHHRWLSQFWTPNRESYIGHAQLIVDSELRQAYEAHDPGLADFVAEAIPIFARQELD